MKLTMITPEKVVSTLRCQRFSCADEDELQRAVAVALDAAGIPYQREKRLGVRDRLDFMIAGRVVLELKVKTDGKSLLRQILRYAEHRDVTAIVVASTTHHALRLPLTANGKPVHAVHLMSW